MQDHHEEIERLRAAVDELKLLNEIALEATAAASVEEILGMIIDKSLKVVNAEQGSILLVSDESNASLKTFIRQDNRSSLRNSYRVGVHITGYVLYHREPLRIDDLAHDPRFEPDEQERAEIHSVLCVPIINQGHLIGAFMMTNKKSGNAFTKDDQRLLMILGGQSGQLIANARLQTETNRKKEELALARVEAEKLRELDELKSRFFAEISHELRAPLALILGPLDQLLSGPTTRDVQSDYRLMWRNARRLLRLVTQLLDSVRLEAGSLRLCVSEGGIASLVGSIVSAFQPLAEQKAIVLSLATSSGNLRGWFDPDKIETILYNLLSNALKFTPAQGNIGVDLTCIGESSEGLQRVRITVADSGRGIPPKDLEHLFDRYYQVRAEDRRTGSGLGLNLTKGIVELHHGRITVQSGENRGSIFTVELPLERNSYTPEEIAEYPSRQSEIQDKADQLMEELPTEESSTLLPPPGPAADRALPAMLIIEDETEMRQFLRDSFKKKFKIFEASEAGIALTIAQDTIPDIVICDVVLSGTDGIHLCRSLKGDERTSHIPVVLLTAEASQDSRIAGLAAGADDYLTKPFDWPELVTRVQNLVDSRKQLRERYTRSSPLSLSEIAVSSMDQIFLQKVMTAVERSMGDETFGVEELARDVAMSYSQLHRKLTAILNQSPNQFIRSIRLHRAKELIERNAATISEIAYTVGFGSPAYFTKCFHEQFGIVPTQVEQKGTRPPQN